MHFVFNGGSELQQRWFLEAARSLEGVTDFREVFSHSEFRDWLPAIEGYPIFELPMWVEVTWEGDPDPSSHNEWAFTENAITTRAGPLNSIGPDAPWIGPVYFSPVPGGDDWTDVPFGIRSDLVQGAVQDVDGATWPTSKVQIKHDLHTKGEEIYKYVVRHELGHVLMNTLGDYEIGNIALTFGQPNAGAPALEWFYGEGKPWAQKGKEAVAETVADLFWLGPDRGPGRFSFNRTRFQLLETPPNEEIFVSMLAPPLGAFGDFFTPVGHPRHPYAQNSDDPPVSSTRAFDAGIMSELISFEWEDGPPTWAQQVSGVPPGPPHEPELWRADLFATPAFYFTTDPEAAAADPFVQSVSEVSHQEAAGNELFPEIIACPGGVTILQVIWGEGLGPGEDQMFQIFQQRFFTGVIDGVGIPQYEFSPGTLEFDITDASGRPCWLPQIKSIGTPHFPFVVGHSYTSVEGVGTVGTFFDEDGPAAGGELGPTGWLHDPRIPLEPINCGTSLEPDTAGQPVYRVRPDCSTIELPLKLHISAAGGGSVGEISAGAGLTMGVPQVGLHLIKQFGANHAQTPPTWVPPWPYGGNIKAEPAPPGSRPRKPSMGAPGPPLVVGT